MWDTNFTVVLKSRYRGKGVGKRGGWDSGVPRKKGGVISIEYRSRRIHPETMRVIENSIKILPKTDTVNIMVHNGRGPEFKYGNMKTFHLAGQYVPEAEDKPIIHMYLTPSENAQSVLYHEFGHHIYDNLATNFLPMRLRTLRNKLERDIWESFIQRKYISDYARSFYREDGSQAVKEAFADIASVYYGRKYWNKKYGVSNYFPDYEHIHKNKFAQSTLKFLTALDRIDWRKYRKNLNAVYKGIKKITKFFDKDWKETTPQNSVYAVVINGDEHLIYVAENTQRGNTPLGRQSDTENYGRRVG